MFGLEGDGHGERNVASTDPSFDVDGCFRPVFCFFLLRVLVFSRPSHEHNDSKPNRAPGIPQAPQDGSLTPPNVMF